MKNYFVRLWNALWASTDIDEKAAEALKYLLERKNTGKIVLKVN